jgi:uncharacterized OB-fold protein
MTATTNPTADAVPIRPGLFVEDLGGPRLIGNRCNRCGTAFVPRESMCPVCITEGTLENELFEGSARLIAHTIVRRGLNGFPSPYALATVQLDAGPSLIAQLQDWELADPLPAGAPLELAIGTIRTDRDGRKVRGPMFSPVGVERA